MLTRHLRFALFSALITAAMAVPIIGLQLQVGGAQVRITGADEGRWLLIFMAVMAVFLVQLFRAPLADLLAKRTLLSADILPDFLHKKRRQSSERWLILLIVAFAVAFPFMAGRGATDLATLALIYVMLGLGLNIVVGLAGLLDLGYVAFYAVGAYSYALLSQYFGVSFWLALPVGALMAATFGFLLGFPVLRLRGDYLAIVTLGFGEIIRILLNNWTQLTGGPNGIGNIPEPTLFGMEFGRRIKQAGNSSFHQVFDIPYDGGHKVIFLYLITLMLALLTWYVIRRLIRMPAGRAWEALREDEIACRSLGISRTIVKLSAFTLGAFFAGLAGTVFAAKQGFISPESFVFLESAIILAIVVLGGMGSQLGVILAAIAVTILPELARQFSEYRMLVFGMAMVMMMVWRPQGLLPMQRQRIYQAPVQRARRPEDTE